MNEEDDFLFYVFFWQTKEMNVSILFLTYTGMLSFGWSLRGSLLCAPFDWRATDIERSLFVISVNEGRASGSRDQHCSISFLHSGSQCLGMGGLRVFFTIPPIFHHPPNKPRIGKEELSQLGKKVFYFYLLSTYL